MDKQKVADLLQEQLDKIPSLQEFTPDDQQFELWKENCVTLFKEFFPDERRFLDNFDWSSFRVNRIKFEEEVGIFTQEDKEAYLKGLQGAEVAIKAALRKFELFGIKPQIKIKEALGVLREVYNRMAEQISTADKDKTVSITMTIDNLPDKITEVIKKSSLKEK